MEADRGHARPVRGCLSLRVYIRIDLVLVTRPQHGGHVERPRARRGVAPSWSAGATARDQPHTDEPAPFEAAEDSQLLINREVARDVVSASISTGRVRALGAAEGRARGDERKSSPGLYQRCPGPTSCVQPRAAVAVSRVRSGAHVPPNTEQT